MSEPTPTELNKMLFTNLVMMLSGSAMQQLGKLVNPVSGKTDVNLDAAQFTIDLLDMLREKTRGNLDKDEERLLADVLSSLQMNYVETAQAAPKPKEEKPGAAPAADPAKPDEPAVAAKDPKFHKAYET